MMRNFENDGYIYECDRCGCGIESLDECRVIDGCIVCTECLRDMSMNELMQVMGITEDEFFRDYIGLDMPSILYESEDII